MLDVAIWLAGGIPFAGDLLAMFVAFVAVGSADLAGAGWAVIGLVVPAGAAGALADDGAGLATVYADGFC